DSGNLDWKIFKAKKKIDGTREQVAYDFGAGKKFSLPPGDYVVGVEMQAARAEAPFSIGVGDAKDIDVVLDAGVVAIEAPGAEKFEIYAAAKDIQGERKQLAYEYAEQMQTTLGAGDYVVVTRFKDDKPNSETPFTVKAGERTELKVP
ncbi:hypothetical protein DOI34_25105, partial [Salmonella enterica subsp. enterica serovar Virchow]|nr:hypothetical protein [Salmonella enterica subsp. enterica serovar Virchow]